MIQTHVNDIWNGIQIVSLIIFEIYTRTVVINIEQRVKSARQIVRVQTYPLVVKFD